ncbi:TVP38/TMEM64 family protein [Methyloglobulus sp.]|uniref:TVP38/TMEM64 family protein n=1 Tax=Methyloglobulus sp. TaxID=2518622 RepID=UPI003988D6FF
MKPSKTQLIAIIAVLVVIFFYFDLQDYLTLAKLQSQQEAILSYRAAHPFMTVVAYGFIYIAVTGLSLPGAAILTLAGGALFGLLWGTVIVSFASSIGATLAFLAARFLFRDSVERQFADRLKTVNDGIAKDGGYYLFTLRLVPLFPFFIINLVMGLTTMKTATFYWISQIGMLAGTLVYVNAGTQLASIKSLSDITSPLLIGSFVLLGIFPLIAKKYVEHRAHDKNQHNP